MTLLHLEICTRNRFYLKRITEFIFTESNIVCSGWAHSKRRDQLKNSNLDVTLSLCHEYFSWTFQSFRFDDTNMKYIVVKILYTNIVV